MNIHKIISSRAFGIVNGVTMCVSSAALSVLPIIDQGVMEDAGRECAKHVNASLIASCLQVPETGIHIASLTLWVIVPIAAVGLGAYIQAGPPCVPDHIGTDEEDSDESDKEALKKQVAILADRVSQLEQKQRLSGKGKDFSSESD